MGLRQRVVRSVRFRDNDHNSGLPCGGVVAEGDTGVENGREGVCNMFPPLFEEFPADTRRARCGIVLGRREEGLGFVLGDGGKGSRRSKGGVIGEMEWNGAQVLGKESISQEVSHGVVVEVQMVV